ncbi:MULTISPECIES: hypothetical protein [Marinovum]|jgi:hypothetical protein|uniref:Lipoprotein n=2 Tax=Marinovum algicola TaxID=42444 RepID=A0A975WEC9_9RHOB|nr:MULTISPECIES: hypothetical protein [Marinovum]AKO99074.1 hypothetical protein MALG_03940 [Marinovum algicola DG 898]MDD9740645.1 hypothetical protein [Marinovum sp. SP66]MDD9746213.1 hypothetical protein [Marinovum sp. PR37]SEK06866.1 hypothetical protein SAMN04487940_12354 [Marinovum algicola]SLN76200.1 hypothetical protein MAA5396_04667 [Marinovum algicola]
MRRKLTCVALGAVLLLAACEGDGGGGDSPRGIATLGQAFVDAFNQIRNSTPVDAQSVNLKLTPKKTPFNP